MKTWHEQHADTRTFGERVADTVANGMGSWRFIIYQTIFVVAWMIINSVHGWGLMWDGYPFILLNLLFSTQAAYAAPIIMMSQNRQSARDRIQAEHDYQTNVESKELLVQLHEKIDAMKNPH